MASPVETADYDSAISSRLARYQALRTQRYASVNVLLLSWRDDDIGCANEVAQMARMFKDDFNYDVWPYKIPSQDPECSLSLTVAQFIKSFGGEENLIIVYYGGHGGPQAATKSPCTWAANVTGGPELDWSFIQPQLFLSASDVVILLDCCFAGQAVRARTSRSVEFLAATDKDQFTATGTGKWPSFTSVLIREMKEMVTENAVVTLPALQRKMVEIEAGLKRQPFYVSLGKDHSAGAIKMTKLGASPGPPKTSDSLQPIYLRLSLFDSLDFATSSALVRWLTKDSPSTIKDVQLISQAFAYAQEIPHTSGPMLQQSTQNQTNLRINWSQKSQQEFERLLGRLQSAFSAGDVDHIISRVKDASLDLNNFVSDSLANLDAASVRGLEAGSFLGADDMKKRLAMRLALLDYECPDSYIRINFEDLGQPGQRLRVGKHGDTPVLVEYMYYDDTEEDSFTRTTRQVRRISTLHMEPKADSFRTLRGIGFLHENLRGARFGLVYALHEDKAGRRFSTLRDLIVRLKHVPLDVRIRLAKSLCEAVVQLHSIGWYHKNINSQNVVIFASNTSAATSSSPESSLDWGFELPYLIGFDCSRPSEAETRGTVDFNTLDNIYRHPDRWGRPVRFEKHHDIYALGLLLTEIGCWRTLPSMDGKRKDFGYIRDPETLREFLLDRVVERVAHATGTKYGSAVQFCLAKQDWSNLEQWQSQRLVRENVLDILQ